MVKESDEYAVEYFETSSRTNGEFWRRFGDQPEWSGKRVLDLGCGHGAMSIQIAQAGGTVVGVDLNEQRVDFAKRNLATCYGELSGSVSFQAADATQDLPIDEPFDIIVSKDTLEHVEDPTSLLRGLRKLLTANGVVYAGFSPLYYSPFGDHGNTGLRLPWLHAVLPKRVVYAASTRHQGRGVSSLADIGLNGNTPEQFRHAFSQSGLFVRELHYNRGDKRLLPMLENARRRVPRFEKFTTVSIYAVLGRAPA